MRSITTQDLLIAMSVLVAFCLANMVMQIVIITKSTIPADTVLTDIRVFRTEVATDHNNALQSLAEIRALIDTDIVRRNTIEERDHYGIGPNKNN